MAETTVRELAEVFGIPVDRLLGRMTESGLPHERADQHINDADKEQLLSHLRRLHGKGEGEAAAPKKISLKRRSVRELKISSPQGRRKTVTVEVRRRRTFTHAPGPGAGNDAPAGVGEVETEAERMAAAKRALQEEAKRRQQELDEALRAEDLLREGQERQRREQEEANRRANAERAAAEALAAAQAAAEAEIASAAEAEAAERRAVESQSAEPAPVAKSEEGGTQSEMAQKVAADQAAAARRSDGRKSERTKRSERERSKSRRTELHVASDKSGRRRKKAKVRPVIRPSSPKHGFEMPTAPVVRDVAIGETITVGELAQRMSIKAGELIKAMMNMGTMATINQVLDQETAAIIVEELGHRVKLLKEESVEDELFLGEDVDAESEPRPPVVTVMGHVDHGKTSLLDYIRRTRVAAGEIGGITQHIGAYRASTPRGDITFLDTPGHAAFTAMRARGVQATDIVILVVAADDGVMPQTVEAVTHAKAAGVPIVVAVNKIDRPETQPERIRQELANHEVIPEEWGGDTMFVDVSAITGQGVDSLLEAISLQAELLELSAPAEGPAKGVVIESRIDRGRGAVATVLVRSGHLSKGDILLAGEEFGRVRMLYDHTGAEVAEAGPSTSVEVLGLSAPPNAGDEAVVVPNERQAREVASYRHGKHREIRLAQQRSASLDNVFEQMTEGETATLNVVVKADVQGSAEALRDALTGLSGDEVQVKVVSSATGGISETDVNLAVASQAIIIGFNVRADASARRLIELESVDVHYFSIIYEVIDVVKQAISGMLKPEIREQIVGIAQVREVFRSKRFGDIAGCMVTEGAVRRSNPIRVLRDNVVIYEGELESLRRFKDDVAEVKSGTECGIGVRHYNDVRAGDQIEVFERVQVERVA